MVVHKQRLTLVELARLAGVSRSTASVAINRRRDIVLAESTRRKVLALAEKHGYQPNLNARNLRAGRSGLIGYVMSDYYLSRGETFMQKFMGIETALRETQYHAVMIGTHESRQGNGRWIIREALSEYHFDGVITDLRPIHASAVMELKTMFPMHMMIEPCLDAVSNKISVDFMQGAMDAVNHLIQKGHVRIGCISGSAGGKEARLEGYRRALAAARIRYDAGLVACGNFDFQQSGRAALRIIRRANRPTAIFAISDFMALAAMRAIRREGLRVPEDISVIGFDDIEAAALSDPLLTTMHVDNYGIGQAAGKMFLDIQRRNQGSIQPVVFKPVLKVRESVMQPRKEQNG